MASSGTCRSCGRAIFWVRSPDGKTMPVDARPVTAYVLRPEGEELRAHRVGDLYAADGLREDRLYISHFVTCPNARDHSRG